MRYFKKPNLKRWQLLPNKWVWACIIAVDNADNEYISFGDTPKDAQLNCEDYVKGELNNKFRGFVSLFSNEDFNKAFANSF